MADIVEVVAINLLAVFFREIHVEGSRVSLTKPITLLPMPWRNLAQMASDIRYIAKEYSRFFPALLIKSQLDIISNDRTHIRNLGELLV